VDSLLKDKSGWQIRALTRNTDSPKAKELASKGVTLIKGDYSDEKVLREGLKGAYAFFAVTNFWDPASMGKEVDLGKRMVDLAKEADVKHFIWSSLQNVEKISKGKYHVPHFTDKAVVEDYAKSKGLFATFIGPAFYYQNFASFFPPKKDDKGNFVFTLPSREDAYITAYDVNDTGDAVLTILKHPDEYKDKFVPLAGAHMHPQDFVKAVGKVTGLPTKYVYVPPEQFAKFGFPGAQELADMFGWFNEFTYFGPHADLSLGKKANPHLKGFEEWLTVSGWKPQ
jgi:uncharacterized protein YbjT (DUF2867 family)